MEFQIVWLQIFLLNQENAKLIVFFFHVILRQNLKQLHQVEYVDVYPRKIDLENVKKLKKFSLTDVV